MLYLCCTQSKSQVQKTTQKQQKISYKNEEKNPLKTRKAESKNSA